MTQQEIIQTEKYKTLKQANKKLRTAETPNEFINTVITLLGWAYDSGVDAQRKAVKDGEDTIIDV